MARDVHTIGLVVHPSPATIDNALTRRSRGWAAGARRPPTARCSCPRPGPPGRRSGRCRPTARVAASRSAATGPCSARCDRRRAARRCRCSAIAVRQPRRAHLRGGAGRSARRWIALPRRRWRSRVISPALARSRATARRVGDAFNDVVDRAGAGPARSILDVDVDGDPVRADGRRRRRSSPRRSARALTRSLRAARSWPPRSGSRGRHAARTARGRHPVDGLRRRHAVSRSASTAAGAARGSTTGASRSREGAKPHPPSFTLEITQRPAAARLLDLDGETLVAGCAAGVIADSPRLRARHARETKTAKTPRVSRSW